VLPSFKRETLGYAFLTFNHLQNGNIDAQRHLWILRNAAILTRRNKPSPGLWQMFRGLVKRAKELQIIINRVTETRGVFYHTQEELQAYLELGAAEGIEVVFSLDRREACDGSATGFPPQGGLVGDKSSTR
jgi:hypothetical protein